MKKEKKELVLKVDLTDEINRIVKEIHMEKAKVAIKRILEIRENLEKQIEANAINLEISRGCLVTLDERMAALTAGDLSVFEMAANDRVCLQQPNAHPWFNELLYKECPRCKLERERGADETGKA